MAVSLLPLFGSVASAGAASKSPITIGASLSLSGDFASDGQAFQRGYELWAADTNKAGGLMGHPVRLKILSDASSPEQVITNYQNLITQSHASLLFGPYSGELTGPAAKVANRYNMAMPEGAGAGTEVFGQGLHNVFLTGISPDALLLPFARWIISMPPGKRPASVAYATSQDPFTEPQVLLARSTLERAGIKTAFFKAFPAEPSGYKALADAVVSSGAQAVVLGANAVDQVSAFTQAFVQQQYNPKILLATAGPDQGAAFVKAVGSSNTEGYMVPNTWYPTFPAPSSQRLVGEYVAKYGGTPSDMSTDVAQAYTVGQVTAQAVLATKGFAGTAIIKYLHSGVTLQTVIGGLKFNSVGESTEGLSFIQQWQHGVIKQVIPRSAPGSVAPEYPKPHWGSS